MGTTIATMTAYGFPITEDQREDIYDHVYEQIDEDGGLYGILEQFPLLEEETAGYYEPDDWFVAVKSSIRTEYDAGWRKIEPLEPDVLRVVGPEAVKQLLAVAELTGVQNPEIGWYRGLYIG